MPFLSLPSAVLMHYEVLRPDGAISDNIDSRSPTLVTLVPFVSPTTMDVPQLRLGSALREDYQIVALSPRSHGRTVSEVRPEHDSFVSAADLAFAFQALRLPPCPIFAPGFVAGRTAVAFTILFPGLVTALCLIGVSEAMQTVEGFRTLDMALLDPPEPADLHETLRELARACYNDHITVEELDDLMSFLVRRHNPRHALRTFEICRSAYLDITFTPDALACIQQPVLVVHGEKDHYTGLGGVESWTDRLYRSRRVETHMIEDAPHCCWVSHSETSTAHVSSFLSRHAPSYQPGYIPPDFDAALRQISTLFENPDALHRDPGVPESFSSLADAEIAEVALDIERIAGYQRTWRARPLIEGAEGVEAWEPPDRTDLHPRQRWRWSRRDDSIVSSPSNQSPRCSTSVTAEIVVQVASTQSAEKVDNPSMYQRPRSIVEVITTPLLTTVSAEDAKRVGSVGEGTSNKGDNRDVVRQDSGYSEEGLSEEGRL